MKLPAKFSKWTSEEQRKWAADELKKVRAKEEELVKLYRLLVSAKGFTPVMQDDDRPDLIAMK